MKKALLIAALVFSSLALVAGCGEVSGKITAIYDTTTSYLYRCEKDQWAIVVLVKDNKEHANCVSAKTAAKYKVGDTYP